MSDIDIVERLVEEAMQYHREMVEDDGGECGECGECGAHRMMRELCEAITKLRADLAGARKAERERCAYAVDKALENGSPQETWNEWERGVECAREDAIEAIAALTDEEQ